MHLEMVSKREIRYDPSEHFLWNLKFFAIISVKGPYILFSMMKCAIILGKYVRGQFSKEATFSNNNFVFSTFQILATGMLKLIFCFICFLIFPSQWLSDMLRSVTHFKTSLYMQI